MEKTVLMLTGLGCANCAIMCPDGAISVFMREEGDEADE